MGYENNTRTFLIMIVQSISIILLWMMLNVLLGIYLGYGFFEGKPNWKNIVYYIGFLISLFFLVRHIKRKWNL